MINFSASYTFRLMLPLVAGILLGNMLVTHFSHVTFHNFPASLFLLGFFMSLSFLLFITLAILWKRDRSFYKEKFGGVLSLLMLTLGSTLYIMEYRATWVDWSKQNQVYRSYLTDRPVVKKKHLRCRARLEGHDVLLYLPDDSVSRTLERGDEVLFYGHLTYSDTAKYDRIFFHQGISGSGFIKAGHWRATGQRHPLTFRQYALACRDRIVDIYRNWGIHGDGLAVLSALTVGQTDELTTELRESFSAAGISHVLALSGLHVGLIWAALTFFLPNYISSEKLRWVRWGGVSSLLLGYVYLAGLPPSAVRAVWMCIIWEANECISIEYTPRIHALLSVTFLLLLVSPFYLFQLSFQLSVMAVGCILAFYEPILEYAQRYFGMHASKVSFLIVPLVAQMGVAPISLYYFHSFPVYFLVTSFFAVFIAEIIVYGAMGLLLATSISVLIAWAGPSPVLTLSNYLISLGSQVLNLMLEGLISSARWISRLPHALLQVEGFRWWEVAAMYLIVILCYRWIVTPTRRRALLLFLGCDLELALWLFR